ncbi:MAG: NADP oxidoreductase [Candidatus Aquicultor primus]|uniref:NADP oxidoreductase n=1 Tax=Candidatus Aquicultor primus TaxID=1797195 RepID=A0A1F2UK82_9ACTN|nr:MAG: NADP oxidoreductase [Candidatus Aquicultor primus]HCG98239.1 Ni/Fe hydrogenase subunit alpha [Actinomycetota bacterium]
MARRDITIAPVTRIEGHAKITVHLDGDGHVQDARLHLTQLRGFEKFCEGRPFYELPFIMQRICGICPVSHAVASAKACDQILSVRVPDAGTRLRKIATLAQVIQSHSLSIFYLSSPDILLGMDAEPEQRNLFGVAKINPQLARDGVYLRKFGQHIIALMSGKRVHPGWIVPGGVARPLSADARAEMVAMLPEALAAAQRSLNWFKQSMEDYRDEIRTFANFPTLFMGIVGPGGGLEHTDGLIRVVDSAGKVIADGVDPADYQDYIGEYAESWSYMKFPFYKKTEPPNNVIRVGPLARLNIIDKVDMPRASQEWAEFRELERGVVFSSFHYHYARLIEVLYSVEKLAVLLDDPNVLSTRIRAKAEPNCLEGVGVAEAPRGMLIHHYKIDDQGLMTWANLTIATGFNNIAMNRGVLQVAKHYIKETKIPEGALNRLEAVIRAFDPCLSCASHAIGQMPMRVQLCGPDGNVLDEVYK